MSATWRAQADMPPPRMTPAGWVRVALRGTALALVLGTGVAATLALRLLERPVWGQKRPLTMHVTQWVCRAVFVILGMRHQIAGRPMDRPGGVVANHASWLDIFALNARKRVFFVAKSDVAGWPGIGFVARTVGTVFIDRDRARADVQRQVFETRLRAGHRLLFFPEGTSTDGFRVLPFKSTLFQAFLGTELRQRMYLQPVTVIYEAPAGQDPRFYGWWGDMDLGPHLLAMLAARRHGTVRIIYHDPVRADDFANRKTLASHLEGIVRSGMPPERQQKG